jgi:hypothetical protein
VTSRRLIAVSGAAVVLAMIAGTALWQSQWAALAIDAVIRFCS